MNGTSSNVSAVLHGANDMRIEKRAMPVVKPDEVLVRIRATGLCGSDLHYFQHGRNGDFHLQHPMCLGHESSGEVIGLGDGVTGLLVGSRIVLEPGMNCESCDYCLEGRYNLCQQMRFASSAKTAPHLDGSLQKFVSWPSRLCHMLPDSVSYEVAALIEPLAVVLQAISRTQLLPGQTVLIFGAGAVGLLASAAAKACGASFVGAVDLDSHRLDFGKRNGWIDETYCLNKPEKTSQVQDPASAVQKDRLQAEALVQHFSSASSTIRKKGSFDVVLECTGVPSCINMSIFSTRPGGKVGLIGMGHPIVTIPLGAAALREVDLVGVFRYANMFPKAIQLLSSGALRAEGEVGQSGTDSSASASPGSVGGIANLISHRYSLEEAGSAFETLRNGRSSDGRGAVKVFVVDAEAQ